MVSSAAEPADLRDLRWVAFTAGPAGRRRLWAALVLPDSHAPWRAARAVTLYLEQGWSVARVSAHPTLIIEEPGALLARLVARRPAGYRSSLLPIELHPGHRAAHARLARILAVRPDTQASIALGD